MNFEDPVPEELITIPLEKYVELTRPDFITIPMKQFVDLCRASAKLSALEGGGVDNWGWYYESLQDHYEEPFPDEPGAETYDD